MDLSLNAEDLRFRSEVREFLKTHLPARIARRQRQGFPVSGTGWTPLQKFIYEVEYGLADAPDISVPGIHLVGPVICRFGSDWLKQKFLTPLLSGELYFAQGFSEPQAGSDLANLKTRAVRDGDDYVVSGQKIWTSEAHHSDYVFALVRTDPAPKPQAGLSMMLIDLKAPGVTVRPIVTIDDCHHVNEVFFDEVRVPVAHRIGEENKAWTYAKFLLDSERTYNAHIGRLLRHLRRIRELAALQERSAGTPVAGEAFRLKLARLDIDIKALEWSVLRVLLADPDGAGLGAAASALKVRGSDLLMRVSEMELDVLGPHALPRFERTDAESDNALPSGASHDAPGLMAQYFYWRASTIFGGSNDIQRSIIWNSIYRN